MSKRELRILLALALLFILITASAFVLVSIQQSADRAAALEESHIQMEFQALDATATAKAAQR